MNELPPLLACARCWNVLYQQDLLAVLAPRPEEQCPDGTFGLSQLVHMLPACLSPEDTVVRYGQVEASGRRIRWMSLFMPQRPNAPA